MKAPASEPPRAKLSGLQIRRGLVAAVAAWAVPGLGHFLVGARGRAAGFFALVVITASVGVYLDGNLAVADPRQPVLTRVEVFANLALGPADPILRATLYGMPLYSRYDLEPGARRQDRNASAQAREARREALERREGRYFETWSSYGTTFLLAACLMNLLVILDAWDIAIGRKE